MHWKLAALIALLGGVQCVALPQEPPPRRFARGVVLVDLRVGDVPGWALIDTGSPHTYVDAGLRDALCGPSDGKPPKQVVQAKLWIAGKLTVRQDVRFLDLDGFNDAVAKQPLIAILGRDLLGSYAIGIDVNRHRMRLWKGGKVPAETILRWVAGKDAAGYPVDIQLDRQPAKPVDEVVALDLATSPESGAWTVQGALGRGGPTRSLLFDTGSSVTSVHWNTLAPLDLKPLASETTAVAFGASARRVVLLPALIVGGVTLHDVKLHVEENMGASDALAPQDLGVEWYVVDPVAGKLYLPKAQIAANR